MFPQQNLDNYQVYTGLSNQVNVFYNLLRSCAGKETVPKNHRDHVKKRSRTFGDYHEFWDGLVPLLGKTESLRWPQKLNLVSKNYQGEMFEGNACWKLFRNADGLWNKGVVQNCSTLDVELFVSALKEMNKIGEICFLMKSLEYPKKTIQMARTFSMTLEVHGVTEHLEERLKHWGNDEGLRLWSEQRCEALHQEFLKIWTKYKINLLMNKRQYQINLFEAVVEFSSTHF